MYGAKDIMKITGFGETKCYRIIDKLQKIMKEENPNVIIIGKRIPKQFFDKYVLGQEGGGSKNE